MSLTTTTATVTRPQADRRAGSLRRTTVVAGLVAAAVTTAVAAALHAAGVSIQVDGEDDSARGLRADDLPGRRDRRSAPRGAQPA
jgi:hypothetical protein